MKADLIIYNIKTLYTPYITPPIRGKDLRNIRQINNAFIAIKDGKIIKTNNLLYDDLINEDTKLIDAGGKIALPGFVDAHTHLVHAGSREEEFAALKAGVPYLEILEKGGGILNTVTKTINATFDELLLQSRTSLNKMIKYGVTTVESKSGYGLDLENELKQLKVSKQLQKDGPAHIVHTYMGAHAVPLRYKDNKEGYIKEIISDLHKIKELDYVTFVDVFCEKGVFELDESEQILNAAKDLGFQIRMHADELETLGGTGLGVKLGSVSVDHLIAASEKDLIALGKSDTYACILPGTSFNLKKPFAKARFMVDNNVAICLAGDYNPGSCPTENFQFIMQLGAGYLNLTPEEVLSAVTLNPAHLLGVSNTKGSIEVNKDADILLLDAPNLAYILYHFGINHVTDVFIKGKHIINGGNF